MFFDIRRKIVGPIIFGDEIEVENGSRVDGRQKGFFARVTDGGRRKSYHKISIVRSSPQQIFLSQIPIKIFNSINHGGITLEGDLLF